MNSIDGFSFLMFSIVLWGVRTIVWWLNFLHESVTSIFCFHWIDFPWTAEFFERKGRSMKFWMRIYYFCTTGRHKHEVKCNHAWKIDRVTMLRQADDKEVTDLAIGDRKKSRGKEKERNEERYARTTNTDTKKSSHWWAISRLISNLRTNCVEKGNYRPLLKMRVLTGLPSLSLRFWNSGSSSFTSTSEFWTEISTCKCRVTEECAFDMKRQDSNIARQKYAEKERERERRGEKKETCGNKAMASGMANKSEVVTVAICSGERSQTRLRTCAIKITQMTVT